MNSVILRLIGYVWCSCASFSLICGLIRMKKVRGLNQFSDDPVSIIMMSFFWPLTLFAVLISFTIKGTIKLAQSSDQYSEKIEKIPAKSNNCCRFNGETWCFDNGEWNKVE